MKNKQFRELAVCGFEAVRALADHHPERIQRLFFTNDRARFFGTVCRELAATKRIYRTVDSEKDLEKLAGSVHHQGVVAMITEPLIPLLDERTLPNVTDSSMLLVLDRVGNANNLGAIVRSAAFFGTETIILSNEDDQARISTSMYRVAQGGMEFVSLWKVPDTAWLLNRIPDSFVRIGADHRSDIDMDGMVELCTAHKKPLIILGNEETGLSPETRQLCDHLVRISGTGRIESLNVAQAATVFLHATAKIVERNRG